MLDWFSDDQCLCLCLCCVETKVMIIDVLVMFYLCCDALEGCLVVGS